MAQYDGKIVIKTAIENEGLVKGTKEVEASLRRSAAQVSNMSNKQAVAIEKAIQSVSKQNAAYAEQQAKIEELKQQLDELSGKQVETTEFQNLNAEIEKLKTKLTEVDAKKQRFIETGGKENSSAFKKMEYDADLLSGRLDDLIQKREELVKSGSAYTAADTSDLTAKLSAETQKLNEMGTRLETTYAGVKTNIDSAANSGVKLGDKMKKSFMTILKYGLGIRGVFVLFNRLRAALVTGFKNLAQSDTATNTAINNVRNALTGLKNSLATAFTPILQIVSPILVKFINLLATAADYVAMFFAALSGKSTYKSAKVVNDVATGMSNTASAAKEAKKQLTGLDEINTWQSNADSGGGGGGGGVGEMFDEKEVTDKIKSIANALDDLAGKLKISFKDVFINWDNLNGEQIAKKVIAGLGAITGAAIGFSIGGVPGAVVGSLLGVAISLVFDSLIFDNDGKISAAEIAKAFIAVAGPLSGGVIGAAVGGVPGALIGVVLGAAISLKILNIGGLEEASATAIDKMTGKYRKSISEEQLQAPLNERIKKLRDAWVSFWGDITGKTEEGGEAVHKTIKTKFDGAEKDGTSAWQRFKQKLSEIWQKIKTNTGADSEATKNYVLASVDGTNTQSNAKLSDMSAKIKQKFSDLGSNIQSTWSTVSTWLGSTWDGIKTNAVTKFTEVKDRVTSVFTGLKENLRGAINGIIGFINRMISGVVSGINTAIRAINKIQVTIPSWIPGIGGKRFGFNIGTISAPQIPLLAKGAVIPPNAPFMAMLGDQKRGNNIETPEKLLRQIVREESSGGNKYDVKAVINGRTLFDIIIDEARKRRDANGSNPFELA